MNIYENCEQSALSELADSGGNRKRAKLDKALHWARFGFEAAQGFNLPPVLLRGWRTLMISTATADLQR
jgi:hypothetical protein